MRCLLSDQFYWEFVFLLPHFILSLFFFISYHFILPLFLDACYLTRGIIGVDLKGIGRAEDLGEVVEEKNLIKKYCVEKKSSVKEKSSKKMT